jgi:hypothetical protein
MPSRVRELARQLLPPGVRRAALRVTGDRLSEQNPARGGGQDGAKPGGQAANPAQQEQRLIEVLRRGGSLAEAVVAQVRADVSEGRAPAAVAVSNALGRRPETAEVGSLAAGIVAFHRGYPKLAWEKLSRLPVELWAAHAPEEYVRAGLSLDPDTTLAAVRELVAAAPSYVAPAGWLAMLGPVFAHGELDLARGLFDVLDRRIEEQSGPDRELVVNRDWLRPWVAGSPDERSAPPVADDAVSFAIMDYGHPGRHRASANIGDHVQSLASLGHLARHEKLELSGPQDLVDLVRQLQGRVRPERELDDVAAKMQLLAVDRDASEFSEIPPNTWTLAFGWFMHAIFDTRYGFPFHPNLLPIFVSFHCSKRDLLTDDAIKYLRQYSPIGCRDWTTVDVLLSVDVPAFFSGCMTTTVSTVFPDTPHKPGADAQVAYVDVPPEDVPDGAPTYRHSDDGIRFRSFAANMYDAIELLETYRRRHSGLVTSRLHCYLPGRSIGVPVDFQPKNRSDPRFAGLIDISDAEFDRIRETISSKLRTVLTAVMSGKSPESVYELWRELNAEDVEAARRRHEAPAEMSGPKADLLAQVDHLRSTRPATPVEDDAVQVVIHARGTTQQALEVLLGSAVEQCSRRVQAWVIARKPDRLDVEGLRAAAGGATVTVVGTGGLGADLRRMDGTKPPGSDTDLLSLGHLLPDVARVVLLPNNSVVVGDLAELADLDLAGKLLAAPTVVGERGASGFGVLHSAGNRLRSRTAASAELRRQGHARHRFDFDAFEVDLLVLDLEEARRRSLLQTYVPYVEEFGLGFREILLLEVGPHRVVLPERWHVVPNRSAEAEPLLVHWAEAAKPWSEDVVEREELWHEAAARVASEVGQRR